MKFSGVRIPAAWFFALAVLGSHAGAATAVLISVVDDRGTTVTLANPARRIVALAPSITELVFAAGAGGQLVGVPLYSDFPAAAKLLPQIGDASRIDLERVLSLKPDLVVAWKSGNHAADFERLRDLGFAVFVAEPDTLEAIPRLLRAIGILTGTADVAAHTAGEFERNIAELRSTYGKRERVRVFYEIWHQPLMTVSGGHMISDVVDLCGGINVFAGAAALTPVVSMEGVIAARPEVVLGGSSAVHPDDFGAQWVREESHPGLRGVRATYIDPDIIQRQTPRVLKGAQTVCESLDRVRAARRALAPAR